MKGLMIWAHSRCRSTLALYEAVGRSLGVPFAIAAYSAEGDLACRTEVGLSGAKEFGHLPVAFVGGSYEKCLELYRAHPGWHHLFGVYQNEPAYRRLMARIKADGGRYGVCSESPCNMFAGGKRLLKEAYLRFLLPFKLRSAIAGADFFLNASGNRSDAARRAGWPADRIFPFGYFPPPLPGSRLSDDHAHREFRILATGELTWHRGADVLLRALVILKRHGYGFKATITQTGPLLPGLRRLARRQGLPVEFTGRVTLPELCRLYETCSVFVGAGRAEPWGMRLNDALNCGAPLVVSRGMGGSALVDDHGCGLTFPRGDARALADALARMMDDPDFHRACRENAARAVASVSPENAARTVIARLG